MADLIIVIIITIVIIIVINITIFYIVLIIISIGYMIDKVRFILIDINGVVFNLFLIYYSCLMIG